MNTYSNTVSVPAISVRFETPIKIDDKTLITRHEAFPFEEIKKLEIVNAGVVQNSEENKKIINLAKAILTKDCIAISYSLQRMTPIDDVVENRYHYFKINDTENAVILSWIDLAVLTNCENVMCFIVNQVALRSLSLCRYAKTPTIFLNPLGQKLSKDEEDIERNIRDIVVKNSHCNSFQDFAKLLPEVFSENRVEYRRSIQSVIPVKDMQNIVIDYLLPSDKRLKRRLLTP